MILVLKLSPYTLYGTIEESLLKTQNILSLANHFLTYLRTYFTSSCSVTFKASTLLLLF